MKNDNNEKLTKYVITFTNDDSTTTKYLVNKPNFYEAKQEAKLMIEDVNSDADIGYKISSFDVKESKHQ